jgi:hypothetical protein
MNNRVRAAANHLYRILKVYLSFALMGALTAIGWGLIDAKPWVGAILFILLESFVIAFYLLRNTAFVLEWGSIRVEFGTKPQGNV